MKNLRYKLKNGILSVIFLSLFFVSKESNAQGCLTPASPNSLERIDMDAFKEQMRSGAPSYVVKVFVHIINEDDGTGGASLDDISQELDDLEQYFEPHDICFVWVGTDEINDSNYASPTTFNQSLADQLIVDYPPIPDVVDIYLIPSYTFFRGTAYAVPNHYLTITSQRFGTPHLAHEMGHCLGLYHTHETAFGIECPDGSNCGTTGDLTCDTPADDDGGWSDSPCSYTGGGSNCGQVLNPPATNIMSYAPFACRNMFTADQEDRMRANLSTASVLQPVKVSATNAHLHNQTISGGNAFGTAFSTIRSGDIYGFGGYDVSNGAYVTFSARDHITLEEGFAASSTGNGFFEASLENFFCSNNSFTTKVNDDDISAVETQISSSVKEDKKWIEKSKLSETVVSDLKVYPNPFSDQTTIKYEIKGDNIPVTLTIFDVMGKRVATPIENVEKTPGIYEVTFDGTELSPGIYYCRLKAGDRVMTKKMVLTR